MTKPRIFKAGILALVVGVVAFICTTDEVDAQERPPCQIFTVSDVRCVYCEKAQNREQAK